MLFNSYGFIFLFLPISLLGFHLIGARGNHRLAMVWLVSVSLFFYGWWNFKYLGLIIASMLGNYAFGEALQTRLRSKMLLATGIILNLALLGYFKYVNFLLDNMDAAFGTDWQIPHVILPLAISFFTFQQITFLIDVYRGNTREHGFLRFCLFVTFFPQLIAGPIVHSGEILPQLTRNMIKSVTARRVAAGLGIFAVGLFKKVAIADGAALYATPVFDAALSGAALSMVEAWGAALAYTFQLYFDFSGYSDMAVGLAFLFGVRLPVNFYSPYKATSIIDFWRRWHMTLSRFLRDYVYVSLGGRHHRARNIMATMLLGGLWHGAGWTFVVWGGMHGVFLVINHAWRHFAPLSLPPVLGRVLTFLVVVLAWVPFRAADWNATIHLYTAMAGLDNLTPALGAERINWATAYGWLAGLLVLVWAAPNTHQLFAREHIVPAAERLPDVPLWKPLSFEWRPTTGWAWSLGVLSVGALLMLTRVSEFLYFQF